MRKSLQNVTSNFVSKIWGFISLYIFSRIYLNLVGIEQYGIISFYTLVFAVTSFADIGLSSSLTREFAKEVGNRYLRGLLLFFERIYIPLCIFCGLSTFFLARYISTRWLNINTESIPLDTVVNCVRLIGFGVATQLMSSIYFGALMGKQLQVWANVVQIILNIFKTVGAVLILYTFNKNIYSFFIWQIVCNIIFVIVIRIKILRSLSMHKSTASLKLNEIPKDFWNYMGGMTLVAILSAVTIQSDKLVASNYLSLNEFGFYSLISSLSQLPIFIITPIAAAIFPLFVKNYSLNKYTHLYRIYSVAVFGVCILVVPVCSVLVLYGDTLLNIWLSSKNMVTAPKQLNFLILFLTLGNTFQALQFLPFYLLMAQGKTRFTVYQAAAELLFLVPGLYFFVKEYQLAGIGVPWFIVKFLGLFYLLIITKKEINKTEKISYRKVIIVPIAVTLLFATIFFLVFRSILSDGTAILSCSLILATSIITNIFLYDKSLFKIGKINILKG